MLSAANTDVSLREELPNFRPVGYLTKSWFSAKNGTPRQPTLCQDSEGVIDFSALEKNFRNINNCHYALEGLVDFSHVWVIFVFHQSFLEGREFSKTKVAPPRLKGKKVGVFSTRSPHRPNLIGLSLATLKEVHGASILIGGIDMIEGTPVLDVKPFIPNYDVPRALLAEVPNERDHQASSRETVPERVALPDWITQESKLDVLFTARALRGLARLTADLQGCKVTKESLVKILQQDPRSEYRRRKCSDRLYFFTTDRIHLTCWFDSEKLENGATVELVEVLKVSLVAEKQAF